MCERHSHETGRLGDILLGIGEHENGRACVWEVPVRRELTAAGVNLTGALCLQAEVHTDFREYSIQWDSEV